METVTKGNTQMKRSRYHKVVITQINWDGKGNNRTFEQFPTDAELPERLRRIRLAYNLAHTRVTVDGNEVAL